MISRESILRRLPPELDPKQALFFDGIRHAGEIAGLAYSRLKSTLTLIAIEELEEELAGQLFTSAFLDAWSLVDVIDRFRALWFQLPHFDSEAADRDKEVFREIARPVRELRNVADHLAQRADYVVARKGAALGSLSWFTVKIKGSEGVICTIIPGTIKPTSIPVLNPAGREIELPTGLIQLSAGEYTANLSQVLFKMEEYIHHIERGIEQSLSAQDLNLGQAGNDLLVKMAVSFKTPSDK